MEWRWFQSEQATHYRYPQKQQQRRVAAVATSDNFALLGTFLKLRRLTFCKFGKLSYVKRKLVAATIIDSDYYCCKKTLIIMSSYLYVHCTTVLNCCFIL